MKTRKLFIDERGIALPMALLVLVTLTGLMLAMLSMSAFEPQISQNLQDTVNARAIADTGLDFAYNVLRNTLDWNTVLAAASNATCVDGASGVLLGAANSSLPGLAPVYGTFTLRVRNDCQPSDASMTGIPVEAGAAKASDDKNGRLVVESTGSKNNASRTMMMVIRKINLQGLDAALAFPGVQSDVNFSGSTFLVDGRDTRMSDTPGSPTGTAPPVFGITTSADYPQNAQAIQNALAGNQQTEVFGKNPNGSSPAVVSGDAAVTPDANLTSQMVTNLVNQAKAIADITINTSSSSPYSIQNVGNSCPSSINHPNCWGTDTAAKIVYVKGTLANPSEQYTSLTIDGTSSGTGILIVENGNLTIGGNFEWHGPIIVTGTNVGIQYLGGGYQKVYGSVIVNQLNNDGPRNLEGVVFGNAKMAYSKEALDLVQRLLSQRSIKTSSVRER
jgi:Tfp pilus assembly protein PilX